LLRREGKGENQLQLYHQYSLPGCCVETQRCGRWFLLVAKAERGKVRWECTLTSSFIGAHTFMAGGGLRAGTGKKGTLDEKKQRIRGLPPRSGTGSAQARTVQFRCWWVGGDRARKRGKSARMTENGRNVKNRHELLREKCCIHVLVNKSYFPGIKDVRKVSEVQDANTR